MSTFTKILERVVDPLGVHEVFEKKGKRPGTIQLQNKDWRRWTMGWSMETADAAYRLILSAGQGNTEAKGQLDAIKAQAAKGNPTAVKIMTYFGPIAKLVAMNAGLPSQLARKQSQKAQQGQQRVAEVARKKGADMMQATIKRQQLAMQQQQRALQAQRLKQVEEAKRRSAAAKRQAVRLAEQTEYENRIADLEKQLERRDISDAMREQLESQAAAYEDQIERIQAAAKGEPAPAVSPVNDSPIAAEGEAAMDPEAYPTGAQGGAPGDVEFTE